jgi:hypothetical protein
VSKYTIKDIYISHWDSYLETAPSLRPVVTKEVSKMMNCQNPDLGHALYQCEDCGKFKCVPFTCKSRFCNCCGIKYQQDRANTLSAKLINCRHRHIVFTVPEELRIYFRKDRKLLHILFTSSAQVLLDWFYSCNKSENFKPGIVSGLHTFGRDLKWNPHIHMLISEGGSGNITVWRKFAHFPYLMLRKKWQTTLLFNMEKYLGKDTFRAMKNMLYRNNPKGFYVYAKPNLSSSYDVVDYIIRYIARPAMAQSRIISVDDEFITFWYQRHEDNKRVEETITIFEFFQRLIVHIPDEQFKMLRYYGIYAKKYIHHSKLIKRISQAVIKSRKLLSRWRERIELSFGYDPTKCSCRQLHVFY